MGSRPRGAFIERSISGAVSFVKEAVFSDEYAMRRGLLQSLDPRVKFVTFAMFLVSVLFAKSTASVTYVYIIALMMARLSNIGLGPFLKRTWVFMPVFAVIIALPALFSVFTPGDALAEFDILGIRLTITSQGLSGAVLFVMRVITSVSLATLLSVTTKHSELLKVLRLFGIPQMFVMIFGMCYRYIYLFAGIVENTFLAVKSRVGYEVHSKKGRHVVAWNMASLWYRSYRLNEEVYSAMLSRGYGGEPVIMNDFKAGMADLAWFCGVLAACSVPLIFKF